MNPMETQYWPFDIPTPERHSPQECREVQYFEAACRAGFRPYRTGTDLYGANSGTRGGIVIRRSFAGKHWELRLGTSEETDLSAHVNEFDCAAEAVLRWLNGAEAAKVLEYIRPRLLVNRRRWVHDIGVGPILYGKKIESGGAATTAPDTAEGQPQR